MYGGDDDGAGRGWEILAEVSANYGGGDDEDEFSVFPPELHEGLAPSLTLALDFPSSSTSAHQFRDGVQEKTEEDSSHVSRTPISGSARRLFELGIKLVRSKLAAVLKSRTSEGRCGERAVWSFAALAGVAGILMYMRRRHRREKQLLLFLILEKDERINQLVDQIVKMSEAITANCKVPVVTRT